MLLSDDYDKSSIPLSPENSIPKLAVLIQQLVADKLHPGIYYCKHSAKPWTSYYEDILKWIFNCFLASPW